MLTTDRLVGIIFFVDGNQAREPELTRGRILAAAFAEFYRNGFQGGSLNGIIKAAATTKGGLFHHFAGKLEVGYAVLDEVIGPLLLVRWLDPVAKSVNPVTDLKRAFRRYVREDIGSAAFVQGCPLNNLAQEMSPLDEGFHERIDKLYRIWRAGWAAALVRGMKAGKVKKAVDPESTAALMVAAQMGIWGMAKSSRNEKLMIQAAEALCGYLDKLKP